MKIFLDDYRIPLDCFAYMFENINKLNPIYKEKDWLIVKSYPEFVKVIDRFKGKITHISFDHDLIDDHYVQDADDMEMDYTSEDLYGDDLKKTGFHAAQYLKQIYASEKLSHPIIMVHSMNPIGAQNITNLFK